MNNKDKNSLAYKIQKNPFILGLFIIVLILVLIVVFSLSSAIKKKTAEFSESTTAQTTQAVTDKKPDVTESVFAVDGVKKRASGIKNVSFGFQKDCATVTVEFNDKEVLMDAHYAGNDFSYDVYPEFCFYVSGGAEIRCPGELKVLGDKSVCYYLYEITDLANAVALTDKLTVNYQNVFSVLKFNVYLRHELNEGVGKTVIGNYGQTAEEFKTLYGQAPLNISSSVSGVKLVEAVKTDEFIWVDIYFDNEDAFNSLNHNFENNFLCFGFEKGGRKYDWKFITTEYSELCMLRCKLDSYALAQFNIEIEGDDLSIKDIFSEYTVSVWSSDYDNDTQLFTIN